MRLQEINDAMKTTQFGQEELINLMELKEWITSTDSISFCGCIITPYYMEYGKMHELYHYEFSLDENENTFEEYVLRVTGKNHVEEIEDRVLETKKKCFCNDFESAREKIAEWINYILKEEQIPKEIEQTYGEYDSSHLYVELFY